MVAICDHVAAADRSGRIIANAGEAGGVRPVGLDRKFSRSTGALVKQSTHQKFFFCARQQTATGDALSICPARPGAAS